MPHLTAVTPSPSPTPTCTPSLHPSMTGIDHYNNSTTPTSVLFVPCLHLAGGGCMSCADWQANPLLLWVFFYLFLGGDSSVCQEAHSFGLCPFLGISVGIAVHRVGIGSAFIWFAFPIRMFAVLCDPPYCPYLIHLTGRLKKTCQLFPI